MAFRSDISIEWYLSPRVIRIAAPSTELSIQDLHDTVRELESRPESMQYPAVIETAGKENLGSGVSVGLTSKLLNAVIAFDARKISQTTGTITSNDTTGILLTDSSATFITDGISPGSWVINLTDNGSVCSVVSVLSETQILTDGLGDGADNQFNISDSYKIWQVVQVEVSGGNLVAVDEFDSEIAAILPTAGTQVSRTLSSSATLQDGTQNLDELSKKVNLNTVLLLSK